MRLLRAFAAAALACSVLTSPALAGDVIQSSGTSDSPSAESGSSGGSSSAVMRGGARSAGGTDASTSQNGSNRARAQQAGTTTSGDAVAGSQTTAAAGSGDGQIQQQDVSADGAAALTGATELTIAVVIAAGPVADGAGSGQSAQAGSNAVEIEQAADATSGDAVAGAQITGVIGADVTIQNTNVAGAPSIGAGGAVALSGDAVAASQVTGVIADSADVQISNAATGVTPTFANSGAADSEALAAVLAGPAGLASGDASSQQFGDNLVDVSQTSGDTASAAIAAGPIAASTFTASADPLGAIFSTAPARAATAAQIGNEDIGLSEVTTSMSGDAVSGSQVSGIAAVSDATVQASNVADDPFAASGTDTPAASALNAAAIHGGPVVNARELGMATQHGDVRAFAGQHATAGSGDAVAGSHVTGVASLDATVQITGAGIGPDGSFATSGEVEASNVLTGVAGPFGFSRETTLASLVGDIVIEVIQDSVSASGDAVSAGQITGTTSAFTRA